MFTTWPQPHQLHSGKMGRKFFQTLAGGEFVIRPGENFVNTYEANEMFTTWLQTHQLQRRKSEVDDTEETKFVYFLPRVGVQRNNTYGVKRNNTYEQQPCGLTSFPHVFKPDTDPEADQNRGRRSPAKFVNRRVRQPPKTSSSEFVLHCSRNQYCYCR